MTETTLTTTPIAFDAVADFVREDGELTGRRYYERRLRTALAALIVTSLALILASLWTNQERWRLDEGLQRSLHAMDRLSRLSDAVSAHAAAFRGHLVQRDAASLLGLQNSRENMLRLLETVEREAAARPEQRATAAQLTEQLDELNAFLDGVSRLLLNAGHAAAQERYRSGTESDRLAAIGETLATMRLQQERTLLLHDAGLQRRDNWLQLALGAALLAQLALAALVYCTLRGANRRRRVDATR